jgi:hypothetical protein
MRLEGCSLNEMLLCCEYFKWEGNAWALYILTFRRVWRRVFFFCRLSGEGLALTCKGVVWGNLLVLFFGCFADGYTAVWLFYATGNKTSLLFSFVPSKLVPVKLGRIMRIIMRGMKTGTFWSRDWYPINNKVVAFSWRKLQENSAAELAAAKIMSATLWLVG